MRQCPGVPACFGLRQKGNDVVVFAAAAAEVQLLQQGEPGADGGNAKTRCLVEAKNIEKRLR